MTNPTTTETKLLHLTGRSDSGRWSVYILDREDGWRLEEASRQYVAALATAQDLACEPWIRCVVLAPAGACPADIASYAELWGHRA